MKTLFSLAFGFLSGLCLGLALNSPAALILTELAPQARYGEELTTGFKAITGQLTGLAEQQPRTWTSTQGNTVEGTLERVGRDTVTIHTTDHRFLSVPIEQLSLKDRVFVRLQHNNQ